MRGTRLRTVTRSSGSWVYSVLDEQPFYQWRVDSGRVLTRLGSTVMLIFVDPVRMDEFVPVNWLRRLFYPIDAG